MRRSPIKRTRKVRDWRPARAKIDHEYRCRAWASGDCEGKIEAAHVIDVAAACLLSGEVVEAIDVVPLCKAHHMAYDGRRFDLLPFLRVDEQARAVLVAGGMTSAMRRISNIGGNS